MKSETIYVTKEAYIALSEKSRIQRGCKPLTLEQYEKRFKKMPACRIKNGLIRLDDNSMGGGDGTYNGKWTTWSVDDLKKMLSEMGHTWERGEDIEYMLVNL